MHTSALLHAHELAHTNHTHRHTRARAHAHTHTHLYQPGDIINIGKKIVLPIGKNLEWMVETYGASWYQLALTNPRKVVQVLAHVHTYIFTHAYALHTCLCTHTQKLPCA